eukprot:7016543-Prymnesium_polylepis.1
MQSGGVVRTSYTLEGFCRTEPWHAQRAAYRAPHHKQVQAWFSSVTKVGSERTCRLPCALPAPPAATTVAATTVAAATAVAAAATAVAAATAAAIPTAAATFLLDPTLDLNSTVLTFALVKLLAEVHGGAGRKSIAVRDLGEVAEQIFAPGVGLDEAEALLVPALGSSLLKALRRRASHAAATSLAAATATAAAAVASLLRGSTGHLLGAFLALALV